MMVQNRYEETCNITVVKPNAKASQLKRFNENEIRPTLQFRPNLCQNSLISLVASFLKKSTDIRNSYGKGIVLANSALGDVKHVPSTTKSTLFGSSNNHDSQFMPLAIVFTSLAFPVKVSQFNVVTNKSLPSKKALLSSAFSKQVSDSSSSILTSSTPSLSSSFLRCQPHHSHQSPHQFLCHHLQQSIHYPQSFSFSIAFSMMSTSSATEFSKSMTSSIVNVVSNKKAYSSSPSVSLSVVISYSYSYSLSIQPFQILVPSPTDSPPVSSTSKASNIGRDHDHAWSTPCDQTIRSRLEFRTS